ncbi:LON peptidase substrate-binding domain-containing protein [Photobacterium carnosum]|uniref:LON peptidase substrate-binding domain-containing protein n=1 Tax=Photobacterium carnosum TaxID=2023717 RepID=UPI001E466964|nr:LON peptidase substrate-binding domain-containing protein [Photobacterium carnosum]MCD9513536.1 Lon protease [Photobacterium carnosum]
MNTIALLPHNEHLLPEGRLKLVISRICDMRMVTEAITNNQPFALGMIANKSSPETVTSIPAIATTAAIIDFNALNSGLLEIVVEGINKISISTLTMAHDKLLTATYQRSHNWPTIKINTNNKLLADKLKLLFISIPEISQYYPQPNYQNTTWVCQRWLEILPIDIKHKQSLIHHQTADITISFLLQLLQNHNLINN